MVVFGIVQVLRDFSAEVFAILVEFRIIPILLESG